MHSSMPFGEADHSGRFCLSARRALAIGVLVAICLIALPESSGADNVLSHRLFSQNWTMGYQNLTENFRQAGDYTINWNINPHPDLNVNSITTSGVGQINLFDDNYSGVTWSGLWECVSYSSPNVCQQGNTYFNLLKGPYSSRDARSLVCEEVGHGVGLAHNSDSATKSSSCMQRPVCWACTRWNDHDNDEIAAKY